MGVALFGHACDACADAAVLRQRHGQVHRAAMVVPRAHAGRGRAREHLAVGVLAHHVDGGRRIARAREQARGAAHHFDAVIDGGIGARVTVERQADGGGHAVVLQVVHVEAARVEVRAVAVRADDMDAGDAAHGVVEREQALVLDLLAREHADGLRRVAQRQAQARGRRRGRRGVGARAFGGGAGLGRGRDQHGPECLGGPRACRTRSTRRAGGGRHHGHLAQGVAAAGRAHGRQRRAQQGAVQRLLHSEAPAHAAAAQPFGDGRAEGDQHAGLAPELVEHAFQRAGCNVVLALLRSTGSRLRPGLCRSQGACGSQPRQRARAQHLQRQRHGPQRRGCLGWTDGGGGSLPHGVLAHGLRAHGKALLQWL